MTSIVAATRLTGGSRFGYKPLLLGQRLKALAFTSFKPLCFSRVARPFKGPSDYRLPPKGVLLDIFLNGVLIQTYCTHIISFRPEVPIPKFVLQICVPVKHH